MMISKIKNAYIDNIQEKLDKANVLFSRREFITMKLYGLLVGVTTGTIFSFIAYYDTYNTLISSTIACTFSVLGLITPNVWIKYLTYKRKKLLENQLEDTLMNINKELKHDDDILQAMKIVADKMPYPVGHDLNRLRNESFISNNIPKSIDEIKESLIKRA